MINKNIRTFISLVRAGLCGEKASIPEDFNPEWLYSLAKAHRIMNLCFHGASVCGLDGNSVAMQKLYVGAVAELASHERQKKELENLFCEFEKNKISFMPLKGIKLKALYKKPEMRSMGDADILIRMEEYNSIKEIVSGLGFEYKYESNHEIVWKKSKTINIELHKALFPRYNEDFFSYFDDGWSLAVKDGSSYRHIMSNENEFLYVFVHFAKHYRGGGIGVRQLCDLWLLLQNPKLDVTVIDSEMETLGLTEFYKNVRRTLKFWFENGEADEKVELITKTIINNGAFGTELSSQNAFAVRIATEKNFCKSKAKLAMWMFKIFPSAKFIKHKYPFLKKRHWLLPVAWALRWFDAVFLNRRKIKRGIKAIKNTSSEKALQTEKDLLAVGLRFNFTEE